MTDAPLYLDHNATTPLLPEVVEAMVRAVGDGFANPASTHAAGRRARRLVEDARERIAELLGLETGFGRADRLIFTSGGTESNNGALEGLLPAATRAGAHLLISAVEHPSIVGPAQRLEAAGVVVERLPVDRAGRVEPAAMADRLRPATRLVAVMLANNETGTVQPIGALAEACRSRGVTTYCDAAQGVGKIDVNFRRLGVDALGAAAHKFHGPRGIGLLVVRHATVLRPLLVGGFQQAGLRPGTESPMLVAGCRAALEAAHREGAARRERLTTLRDDFERRLAGELPAIVVHARAADRLPQTSSIAFVGVDRQALFIALDRAGVACSTGSACASGSSEPSPTLVAMGCPDEQVSSTIRFSFGVTTTPEETSEATRRIVRVYNDLRAAAERRKTASSGR